MISDIGRYQQKQKLDFVKISVMTNRHYTTATGKDVFKLNF
mgnify:CR=1 FL=1